MKEFIESLKLENLLLVVGIFLGSVSACARLEKISWKRVAKEMVLSYTAALAMYALCRAFGANEWLTVFFVSVSSYSGARTLPFFEWLFRSTTIQVTEKTLNVDLDDKEGMQ